MSMLTVKVLSSIAIGTLDQLFTNGPTWDGNILSKSGRDELVNTGLAKRVNGWAFLTEEGVIAAAEWESPVGSRWHNKAKRQR